MRGRVITGILGVGAIAGLVVAAATGASGATSITGKAVLHPVQNSGVSGTATLATDRTGLTFISVQAQGMASLTSYGFVLMTPQCAAIKQSLNPIDSDAAGDGGSTSQVSGVPDSSWWLGIVNGEGAAVACGQVQPTNAGPTPTATPGSVTPITPAPSSATPTPNPTTAPGSGPTDYPTVTPTPAPTGVTVPVATPTPLPTPSGTPHPPPGS